MKKTIASAVSILAFCVCGFAQARHSRIVAEVALTDQTQTVPTRTLFVPKNNGTFRLTGYMVNDVAVSGTGYWQATIGWTDNAGTWSLPQWYVTTATVSNSAMEVVAPSGIVTVRAKAGTPITYSVNSGAAGSTYELYITVEQIQ